MSTGPCFIRALPGFFEPFSSLSHLTAAAVGLVGSIPMMRLGRGCRIRFSSVAIYTFSVVAMLLISGSYHSLTGGPARAIMQRMDYSAIWLLIAGTFTAIHGVMHRGRWRSWVLAFVWVCAIAGMLLHVFAFHAFSGFTGLALYLGMGWVGLLSIIKTGKQIGFRAVRPIWIAGIVFSAGAVLEATKHPTLVAGWIGPHEVFHVAVLVGIALHWKFIREVLTVHAPLPTLALPPRLGP